MDKKKLIQIIVIIIAFGGSGIVLYNGLYKGSAPSSAVSVSSMTGSGAVVVSGLAVGAANPLLPYGDKLDFTGILGKQGLQYDAISFPTLNTSTEVGIYDAAHQVYTQPLIQAPVSAPSQ